MALPEFTMRQLLEAGVHFGHHTRRWNPKMRPFIFGVRNGVHIIDLQQTQPMLANSLKAMRDIVANGGRILFVGTKKTGARADRRGCKALRPILCKPPLAGRNADQLENDLYLHQRPARFG